MTRRRFVLLALLSVAVGSLAGVHLRRALAPPPEPPRCVLVRMERLPGAPTLNLPGAPIYGGGLYEWWACDDVLVRAWVGP